MASKDNDVVLGENQELANLMMRNIKEIGLFSYDLEEKRENSVFALASRMTMAAIVLLSSIFVMAIALSEFRSWLVAPIFSTLASIVCMFMAQWRYRYEVIQDVGAFFKEVCDNQDCYVTQAQFDFQWKDQIAQIHMSKRKVNDRRVKWFTASMVLFFASIGLFCAPIAYFLLFG